MLENCRQDSLLEIFFNRFQQFFNLPRSCGDPGWYSLADVARMLGYPSCRAAKTLLPETATSCRGRAVSVAGIAILALKAGNPGVSERVRALCAAVMSDLLAPTAPGPNGGLADLCMEIRAVLDKYSQKGTCNFSGAGLEDCFYGTLTTVGSAPDACYNAFAL